MSLSDRCRCRTGVVLPYRNNPKDQATLFNQFFADQFSEASSYDIDIDWHNDEDNDIDFNISKVRNLLKLVKPRKASGPDRIHGLVSRIKKLCFWFGLSTE